MRAVFLTLGIAFGSVQPARAADNDVAAYLTQMEADGLVDKGAASKQRLAQEVRLAADALLQGRAEDAASRLYRVVQAPAYRDFSDTPDFIDAEYRLGLALTRAGSSITARIYLLAAISRGKASPFFEPALRTLVDGCLADETLKRCEHDINEMALDEPSLSESQRGELDYLRGRAAFFAHDSQQAEISLKEVSPQSRFYTSAIYLRGVLLVQAGKFAQASDAFCSIADVRPGEPLHFFIDGRFYALTDLARLQLGRIAHEELRFDDAFYHYFKIPSDSPKLQDALFESAWSSLERKEYDLGRKLSEEYIRLFPASARVPEVRLLLATMQARTCKFTAAYGELDAFVARYRALVAEIDKTEHDDAAKKALSEQLLDDSGPPNLLRSLLQLNPAFFRIDRLKRSLVDELAQSAATERQYVDILQHLREQAVRSVQSSAAMAAPFDEPVHPDFALLHQQLLALGPAGTLEGKRQDLLHRVDQLAVSSPHDNQGKLAALLQTDLDHLRDLRRQTTRLLSRFETAQASLLTSALGDLRRELDQLLGRAELVRIDAKMFEKRKLESEIEGLAKGRFPPEMFHKLQLEGLISDDEEFWPEEGERWSDEYENYR